jgi:hypothetical protein
MSQARVYCKTEAGLDEVQRRHTGLNARVRQLLILVDGKRSVAELSRMMALVEFEEFLALLELKGLISAKDSTDLVATDDAKNTQVEVRSLAPERSASLDPMSFTLEDVESVVALAPQPGLPANVSSRSSESVRLDVDRLNMARLLQETVGPLADDLCHRIARASRRAELAELFVASLTVVELMSGRKAADRFVEKMKQMGWEV